MANLIGGGNSQSLNGTSNNQPHLNDNPQNLANPPQKPFDLAQSLEVAEHLDECYAENFVSLLTSLSNVVLFSAAIPYQDGTHHINCKPPTYWAKIFAKHNFVCVDILREKIWDNEAIACWYRQNVLLFIHKDSKSLARFKASQNPLYLVHYGIWEGTMQHLRFIESDCQKWHRKYHKTLPKRLERLFKKIKAKIKGR